MSFRMGDVGDSGRVFMLARLLAVAAGSLLQWTVLGAALLTGLFIGSTIFTESITRSRYPEYAAYQARTSPIVPWFPRHAVPDRATA